MKVVDFLAEELKAEQAKKQEATKTRKAGKHGRISEMLKTLAEQKTPLSDDLATVLGMGD